MYDESSEDHGGDAPVSYSENPYKQRSSREDPPDRQDEGGRSVGTEDDRGGSRHRDGGDRGGQREDRRDSHRDDDRDRRRHREDRGDKDRGDRRDRDDRGDRDRERRHEDRRDRHRSSRSHRSRSRSRSREPRKRSRQTGFDQGPAGATGAPAVVNPLNPLAAVAGMPGLGGFPPQAMTQQATRHARRVYVGGLPPLANEQSIAKFFSQALAAVGGTSGGTGDAVVNVYINQEKKFAFVEFRTVEETSNAMALDGIMFEGVSVRVRRPNDYNPAMASTLGPSTPNPSLNLQAIGLGIAPGMAGMPGGMPGMVPQPQADGPDRIFVGGLPYYLNEEQIRELLAQFGELQAFDLVKDRETGNSKGYGFAVYRDPSVVDVACAGLNGLKMGDKTLTVRRATAVGQAKPDTQAVIEQAQQQIAISMALQQGSLKIGGPVAAGATKILVLQEIVDDEELKDDEAYEEIKEDMDDECGKYGAVTKIVIPRPSPAGEHVPGLGKVFVEYADTDGSGKAQVALNGRKFGGKAVKAEFMSEEKFAAGDFSE
ncbi:hypothetical protein CYMTET_7370 [Cymbomonas tetramitiformis]|uniref:Splicing factor U2af large subunit n=1 Tax=Cymbomonas tetramitiformis TaxID=36881 RepID=A0AAE0LHJ2_9CHLO|nr:hypothetical protein CYMTET_7370 [Cymbomonas tetramitiformis]